MPASIAIVGAGPRGASLLERIGAHLSRSDAPFRGEAVELHIVDEAQFGAGRIWRTDQTRELCMNTLADAVTLFTEPGASVAAPVQQGPTLYEWCVLVLEAQLGGEALTEELREARERIPEAHVSMLASFPLREGLAESYRDELRALRPDSHPSRALYGEYLVWCFERAIAALPPEVHVVRHRARAVRIARVADGRERVELSDGSAIAADSLVLATGWMPRGETADERELTAVVAARPELVWVRPGSPVEQDLSRVPAGAPVIVRGLGMGFFDTMALLTAGRGGRFVSDAAAPGGLRYEASGEEPVLHVTSGRGVPFRAKTLYGSLPPRAKQRFLLGVDWSRLPRPINFDRELWPRVVADAYFDHYRTLRRVRPEAATGAAEEVEPLIAAAILPHLGEDAAPEPLTAAARSVAAAVAPFIPDPADRFDLLGEMRPVGQLHPSAEAFDAWVVDRVERDLAEAELGHDSAVKAGLWSVSSARGVAQVVGALGGFDAESRESGYAMTHAVGAMAGSGPPAFRNRQLLALARAGLVHFIGPRAALTVTDAGFVAESPLVSQSSVTSSTLIDAWMHFHDVGETADPLAQSLLDAGRARAFAISARGGDSRPTGAFDVDLATGRLVTPSGDLDSSVHVAGIPVDDALHGTIISPMPGTDPPMLRETDRVAGSLLETALRARSDRGEGSFGGSRDPHPASPAHDIPSPFEGASRA
ncbi:FAD/NAD(P)-binding protein [Leucobacter sp. USHLN153]|uniref:FAD/NAD(P)-binding protein n=1 Tax=Leucobacter sp. USHLN153 TaxID=3081268 RepID=UPI0030178754